MTADFNKFTWHKVMIRSSDLNTTTKLVGAAMFDYSDKHGFKVHPSKLTLAKNTGLSKSTVHRAIRCLHDAGWIRLVAEGGFSDAFNRPNEWRLVYPAGLELEDDEGPGVTGDTPRYQERHHGVSLAARGGFTGDTQTSHTSNQDQSIENRPRSFAPTLVTTGGGFGGFDDEQRETSEFDPWSGTSESRKCADCQRIPGGFGCPNCHAA